MLHAGGASPDLDGAALSRGLLRLPARRFYFFALLFPFFSGGGDMWPSRHELGSAVSPPPRPHSPPYGLTKLPRRPPPAPGVPPRVEGARGVSAALALSADALLASPRAVAPKFRATARSLAVSHAPRCMGACHVGTHNLNLKFLKFFRSQKSFLVFNDLLKTRIETKNNVANHQSMSARVFINHCQKAHRKSFSICVL